MYSPQCNLVSRNFMLEVLRMDTQTAIAQRIIQLCEENGITVNKLATTAGIPRSSIKNILYGKSNNPGIITIKKICDALGICLADFFDTDKLRNLEQEIK